MPGVLPSPHAGALADGTRPSVMFVTGHLPYPPVSGGRRREYELITRLCDVFDFHLIVISKTPDEDAANASTFRQHCTTVEVWPAVQPPGASLFPRPPMLALRHWAPEATDSIRRRLAEGGIDAVHVEATGDQR